MKLRLITPLVVAALVASAPTSAQYEKGYGAKPTASAASAKTVMAVGEVRKVDRTNGTVTIKHGPLEALGMGPMTMSFTAIEPERLATVKEGDKVRFEPRQTSDGKLMVGRIEVVK